MYHFFIIPSDMVVSFPLGSVYFFKAAVLKNSALDLYSQVLLINGAIIANLNKAIVMLVALLR